MTSSSHMNIFTIYNTESKLTKPILFVNDQRHVGKIIQFKIIIPSNSPITVSSCEPLCVSIDQLQYIPRNMHTVLLCCALLWLCNHSQWIHMKYLSIFIRVALLALGQSLDCHSASEVSLMDMGKSANVKPQQSTAKQKPCAYFLGYTVLLVPQFVKYKSKGHFKDSY